MIMYLFTKRLQYHQTHYDHCPRHNQTPRFIGTFFSVTLAANYYTKQFNSLTRASFAACCISTRFAVTSNEI